MIGRGMARCLEKTETDETNKMIGVMYRTILFIVVVSRTLQITECKRLPQNYAKATVDRKPQIVKKAPAFCIRCIWLLAY